MSSIRLFILGSLAERGPMHGHAIRHLAEEEHVDQWADFAVGALYGAIKRLAAEQLIESVRTEREGNYPERQVYGVTAAGVASLDQIRREALETIVYRPDPVDLALSRLGDVDHATVREVLETRLADLESRLVAEEQKQARIAPFLTLMEQHVSNHDSHRIRGEISWHEQLLEALPEIINDENSRKGRTP